MKSPHLTRALRLAVLLCTALAWAIPLRAEELSDSVLLVAKRQFQDRFYGSTVLIAKPMGNDRHVGFIVNRPTPVTLGKLYPEHEPSQKIVDPVFLGGPLRTEIIFAIVQRSDSPGGQSMRLAPDLFVAIERSVIDQIIEAEADHARFVAGMVLWSPGELRAEIKPGFWYVRDPDPEVVLNRTPEGVWEELVGRAERAANGI